MDRLLLEDRIFSVMQEIARSNNIEYRERVYNTRPHPGWDPKLRHYILGFFEELKEYNYSSLNIEEDTIRKLFDLVEGLIDVRDLSLTLRLFVDHIKRASAGFNYQMLSTIVESSNRPENVFVSPARLQAILAWINNWSYELFDTIIPCICRRKADRRESIDMFADERFLIPEHDSKYSNSGNVPVIDLKTMFLYNENTYINKHIQDEIKRFFNVELAPVDFKDKNIEPMINEIVEKASHGLIKNVDHEIDEDTKALLIDILYFKAQWAEPFEERDTKDRNFYYKGGSSKVKMMKKIDDLNYFENDVFQSVAVGYRSWVRNRDYAMLIHLPKKGHTISETLNQLSENDIFRQYKNTEVKLSLPQFELKTKIQVKEVLKKMELASLFDSKDVIPVLMQDVMISDIMQQGKISVNEYGTEAAVFTCCDVMGGCLPMEKPKPVEMKVNHEFIFEIVETNSGMRLFSGIVNEL